MQHSLDLNLQSLGWQTKALPIMLPLLPTLWVMGGHRNEHGWRVWKPVMPQGHTILHNRLSLSNSQRADRRGRVRITTMCDGDGESEEKISCEKRLCFHVWRRVRNKPGCLEDWDKDGKMLHPKSWGNLQFGSTALQLYSSWFAMWTGLDWACHGFQVTNANRNSLLWM